MPQAVLPAVGYLVAAGSAATIGGLVLTVASTIVLAEIGRDRQRDLRDPDSPGPQGGQGAIRAAAIRPATWSFGKSRVALQAAFHGESETQLRVVYPISQGEVHRIRGIWSLDHGIRVPIAVGRSQLVTWFGTGSPPFSPAAQVPGVTYSDTIVFDDGGGIADPVVYRGAETGGETLSDAEGVNPLFEPGRAVYVQVGDTFVFVGGAPEVGAGSDILDLESEVQDFGDVGGADVETPGGSLSDALRDAIEAASGDQPEGRDFVNIQAERGDVLASYDTSFGGRSININTDLDGFGEAFDAAHDHVRDNPDQEVYVNVRTSVFDEQGNLVNVITHQSFVVRVNDDDVIETVDRDEALRRAQVDDDEDDQDRGGGGDTGVDLGGGRPETESNPGGIGGV